MEQFRTKIKHILPFLLALVILISCIPPIQASAASSLTLSGVWCIGYGWASDVEHGDIRDFTVSVDAYVYTDGSIRSITEIFLDAREPESIGASWYGGADRMWDTSGDHWADGGLIYFNSPVTITDAHAIAFFSTYAWECEPNILSIDDHEEHRHYSIWTSQCVIDASSATFDCNLCSWSSVWTPSASKGTFLGFSDPDGGFYSGQVVIEFDGSLYLSSAYSSPVVPDPEPDPDPGTTYSSIIIIDGQEFTFTSTTEQPAVLLQVTTAGAILSYNGQSQIFTYTGDGKFLGLSFASIYDPAYTPGNSYLLASGRATLFSVNDGTSSGVSVYETTIIIDGSVYQFFSEESYPLVTCFLSSEGVQLVCGDDNRWWRPHYNQEFLGLSLRPNSSEPDFSLYDEYFVVRGSSEEVAFQFYSFCVESEDNSWSLIFRRSAEIFLIPVAVFFTFEFLPGISIGSVMIISLVLGILFFFLKSSK